MPKTTSEEPYTYKSYFFRCNSMPASGATEVPAPDRSEAKYLGFVSDGASSATKYAGDTYSTVRSKVSGWKHIEAVLDFVESTASPWGAKAQDIGTKALLFADGTVEKGHTWVKVGTDKANATSKSWLGEERYKGLTDAANTMTSEVSEVYSTARSKGVVPAGSKAWEKTKAYAGSAYAYCNDVVAKGYTTAKDNGQSYSSALFDKVSSYYSSIHGAVTSSPYYASLHNLAYKTASYVASLSVVKKPAEAVFSATYPHFKGYVDPAIAKIEPRMQALQQHLEPRTNEEAVTSDPKQLTKEAKANAKAGTKQAKAQAKQAAPSAEQASESVQGCFECGEDGAAGGKGGGIRYPFRGSQCREQPQGQGQKKTRRQQARPHA
eukprot:TRINITY_DN6520_c0_g1_i4.p1 TRINITY_DN6520_c0_g1~~TRINITY_DN6520_c0_g1_i4.p1  ORF type:complete len:379 (-),score=52.68 TRINITY_DN6520_c0_g1_i4:468-1604(-)